MQDPESVAGAEGSESGSSLVLMIGRLSVVFQADLHFEEVGPLCQLRARSG